jgi:hypothetical protein
MVVGILFEILVQNRFLQTLAAPPDLVKNSVFLLMPGWLKIYCLAIDT